MNTTGLKPRTKYGSRGPVNSEKSLYYEPRHVKLSYYWKGTLLKLNTLCLLFEGSWSLLHRSGEKHLCGDFKRTALVESIKWLQHVTERLTLLLFQKGSFHRVFYLQTFNVPMFIIRFGIGTLVFQPFSPVD